MSHKVKVAGTWRDASPYVKVGGSWKLANEAWNKVGGEWYTSFVKGGLVDRSWDDADETGQYGVEFNDRVYGIVVQSDGKTVIGGDFTTWGGTTPAGYIARLNSDNTLDTAFMSNIGTGASGTVQVIAVQSDGKILVGGSFTSWNGTTVGRFVRLNSNGTLDTAFAANIGTGANSVPYSIIVQSDGKIFVGGAFSSWNGTTVGRIVRLNSDGTRDTAFTTNTGTGANSTVNAIEVQSDGKILVGGWFSSWNGTTVGRVVRLNSNGTRDTAFTTNTGTGANNIVRVVTVQSDGKILVGGSFTSWNGTTVGRFVRLNSNGTLDTAFAANIGTGANNVAYSIIVQSDGKIVIGGFFTSWNVTTVGRVVRLNSDGTLDTAFAANIGILVNNGIYASGMYSDGSFILGGSFYVWGSTRVGYVVRLSPDGVSEILQSFAASNVQVIAVQSDGKILVGGNFVAWNGTAVGRFVRLNSDGTLDTAFMSNIGAGANNYVLSIAVQSDGKILLGGYFTSWDGTSVGYLVRLNSDGTLDTAFMSNIGTSANNYARAIAVQSDGKIVIGGFFTSWNGTTVGRVVRLNSNGTRDTAFTTNTGTGADAPPQVVLLQSDGKIVLCGQEVNWNGTTVGRIVRLNSDGTLDTAFTTNTGTGANNSILSAALQSDGKILVGGTFSSWNGTTVGRVARLNSDGTLDTAFMSNIGTGSNGTVYAIAVQSNGKIIIGRYISAWNGTNIGCTSRLNSDGTLDAAFTTNIGVDATFNLTYSNPAVYYICPQLDEKILIGGDFRFFGSLTQFRSYFVRIGGEIAS